MRRFSIAALTLTLATLSATTLARQQAPTFRSGVALATIDVAVLDKDGKPVTGLTADDIEIKLNGKVQPVRAIAFVQAAAAPATPPASAPAKTAMEPMPAAAPTAAPSPETPRRTVSNANAPSRAAAAAAAAPTAAPAPSPAPPADSRVFVLLVDDLSYSPMRGKALFNAASKFLDRIPASDLVGFSTTSGSGGAINPTRDRAAVRAALTKVVGEFIDPRGIGKSGPGGGCSGQPDLAAGMSEAIDIDRGDDRLFAEVVARECFNGSRNALAGMSVQQMRSDCGCAHDVDTQARRIAALARQNKGRQINAIGSVINSMRTAGGIRHLVLLTEGLPISREVNDLDPLVRTAALSGVQFSVLLEEPDINLTAEGRRAQGDGVKVQTDPGDARRQLEDNAMLVSGAQTMTGMLGGTFYRVIGNADPSFDKVIAASSAVYRLGVELPANATPGKELSVSASVKRPGMTVLANKFAMMPVPDAQTAAAPSKPATIGEPSAANALTTADRVPVSIDDVLKGALNSTTITSDVPMRMALSQRRSAATAAQVDVTLNLAIPSSVKGPIITFVGLIDASSAIRNVRKLLEPVNGVDYAASFVFPLAPGPYRIRVVSTDSSGAIGTVEMPIDVKLAPFGVFTSSDVLTWVVAGGNRAQLFTIEDIPAGADELRASIELYTPGDAASEPPSVKWSLWRDGEAKAIAEENSRAQTSAASLRSDVAFPIAALPAGRYTVRAELMDGDKVAGTRAAVVRKQ